MQDDSSRLGELRAEIDRIVARQVAYERRVWHEAYAWDMWQEADDRQAALARQAERLARQQRSEHVWHTHLRYQARRRLAEIVCRDGYACRYCGTTRGRLDLDHVLPLSRGGSNDNDNLTLACRWCNLSKGQRTPEEWRRR